MSGPITRPGWPPWSGRRPRSRSRFEGGGPGGRLLRQRAAPLPSRVETYHLCRFAYFCRYGLRAKARRPADLDAAQFGTLAHYVMEKLLPVYAQLGFESIRKSRPWKTRRTRSGNMWIPIWAGGKQKQPIRLPAHPADGHLRQPLWQVVLEMRQSRFVPVDYELPIGLPDEEHPEAVEPLRLTLPDGTQVYVQGKVDRVIS